MLRADITEISSNARLKLYPSARVIQVANDNIFKESGWESTSPSRSYYVPSKGNALNPDRSKKVSMLRAKAAIRDIALCNRFDYFFTGTLSPEKVDRYDHKAIYNKVSNFLRNSVHRKGFQYLIVPELHKDGAIHFHGLCNIGNMTIVRAHNPKGVPLSTNRNQPIYNLEDWRLGWSTCIPIDENYEKTCNYITKYITKDSEKIFGKWYLASRNNKKHPDIVLLDHIDYEAFKNEHEYSVEFPLYRDVCICQDYL